VKRVVVLGPVALSLVLGLALAGAFAGGVGADPGTGTTTTTVAATTTAPAPTTTVPAPTTTAPAPTTTAPPPPPAPAPKPKPTFQRGVRIAGVAVSKLSRADAQAAVSQAFAKPVQVAVDGKTFSLQPSAVAAAYVKTAVARARVAAPNTNVKLVVAVRGSALRAWVKTLAARFASTPSDASLTFRGDKPVVTPDRPGRRLDTRALTAKLVAELESNSRLPVHVRTRTTPAHVTVASLGSVIVIDRGANRLTLYTAGKAVRTFPVATGQAIYPTPAGTFHIVTKQRDPWWYPPTYDSWAKGLKPVPPGPSNPLGTRWMGLSVPGVGIHGTDEPSSIGYSESHGCIRMQVPDAEWLFDHVEVGTTVHIV
jgi:lipoprotein-anchoring transpeptidase ErfK/SrfK